MTRAETSKPARPRLSTLSRNFAALFSTQVIGQAVRFLYFVVIARALDPEQVGILTYGMAFYLSICIFANFGQGVFLGSRLGRRPASAAALISHSLTLRLLASLLAVATGMAIVWSLESDDAVATVMTVFMVAVLARSLATWARECFVALEDSTWIPRIELAFRGGEACIGTVLLMSGAGLLAVCGLHVLTWSMEAVAVMILLRRRSGLRLRPGLRMMLLKRIAGVSVVLAVGFALLGFFAQVGVVSLKVLDADTATIAYFGVAMKMLTALLFVPLAFGYALLPALGRVHRQGNRVEVASLAVVIKVGLVGGGVFGVLATAYTADVVDLLLGNRYGPAAGSFAVMAWGFGPYAIALISGHALNALEARPQAALMALVMVLVHVVAMAALMPLGGLHAASVSLVLAALAGCLVGLHCLGPRLGIAGVAWWAGPLVLVAVIFAVCQIDLPNFAWLGPVLAGLLVLVALRLGFLTGDELRTVAERLGLRIGHRNRQLGGGARL